MLKEKSPRSMKKVMQDITLKKNVYKVDKLSLYYLLHPVVHKHDFNNKCYPLFQPLR